MICVVRVLCRCAWSMIFMVQYCALSFKKMVSSQFWFWDLWGTHRQQAQRNPKNTCKLSVGSHRQPHQTKMHSPVKRLDSFPTSCHEKKSSILFQTWFVASLHWLFPIWSLDLWGTNRQQAQTPPSPSASPGGMHSPVKRLDSFPTSCHKKIQHSVPNVICCQLQLFPFLSLDLWGTNRQQAQTNTKKNIMPNVSVSTRLENDQSTMANLAGNIQHRYARTYYLNLSYIRFIKSIKIS